MSSDNIKSLSTIFKYALENKEKSLIRDVVKSVSKGYLYKTPCERWYENPLIDPLLDLDISGDENTLRYQQWKDTCNTQIRSRLLLEDYGIDPGSSSIIHSYIGIKPYKYDKKSMIKKAQDKLDTIRKGNRELTLDDAEFILSNTMRSQMDLISASREGLLGVVKFFLEEEKRVPMTTALVEALSYGHADVAELLLSKGATLQNRFHSAQVDSLTYAIDSQNPDILSLLFEYDLYIDVTYISLLRILRDKNIPFLKVLLLAGLIPHSYLEKISLFAEEEGLDDVLDYIKEIYF